MVRERFLHSWGLLVWIGGVIRSSEKKAICPWRWMIFSVYSSLGTSDLGLKLFILDKGCCSYDVIVCIASLSSLLFELCVDVYLIVWLFL